MKETKRKIDWKEVRGWTVFILICIIICGVVILACLKSEENVKEREVLCNSINGIYNNNFMPNQWNCDVKIDGEYYRYLIDYIDGEWRMLK